MRIIPTLAKGCKLQAAYGPCLINDCCACCRCNLPDLLAGVEALATTLVQQGFYLEALPLVSLWDHLACSIARQLLPTLLSRFTRIQALCSLGLVSEAAAVIVALMWGRNLPNSMLPGELQLEGVKHEQLPVFHAGLWPGHSKNKAAVAEVGGGIVAPALAELYGPWPMGKLMQARAAWLAAVGGTRNCWQGCLPPGGVTVPAAAAASAAAAEGGAGGPVIGTAAAAGATGKGSGNEGKKGAAADTGGKAGKGAAAAATASSGVEAQGTGGLQVPEAIEEKLLETAAVLLQGSISVCRSYLGLPPMIWPEEQATPAAGGGGGNKGGKGGKGGKPPADTPASKTSTAAPTPVAATATPSSSSSPAASKEPGDRDEKRLLQAQQVQLLVEGLLQLAEVEELRWQPFRALGYAGDALQVAREYGDLASGLAGTNEELARFGVGTPLWIRGQMQVRSR